MKKILFVATVDGFHNAFHKDLFKKLSEEGWIVDVVSKGDRSFDYIRRKYNIDISRFPLKFKNFKAIRKLKKIIKENKYDIVHSHTPVGGLIARLANKNKSTKNVYTAHGFHFYKGAPLLNWLIYYPVEKYLARKTDLLITINSEDYERAKKKFKKTKVAKINGVGIDFNKFIIDGDTSYIRKEFGLTNDDFVITSVGELNNNKNQMFAIKNLKPLIKENFQIKYIIVGKGPNKAAYQNYIQKHNLCENIKMVGFRNDIPQILKETNLFISLSKREGQGIGVIEALRMKTITLVTEIRGHKDIIKHNENGYLFKNKEEFKEGVLRVINDYQSLEYLTKKSFLSTNKYNIYEINEKILKLYKKIGVN